MNTKLIRFSKVVFDLLFWFGVLLLIALMALTAFLPALVDGALAKAGQPSLSFLGARAAIDLSEVQVGGLTQFGWALLLAVITAIAAWTYVAHQVRRALGSVLEGSAFRVENYGRLRRIAYAVFAIVPFGIVSQSWMDTVVHGGFHLSIRLQLGTLAIGLLALSLAEIYKAGVTLQDDAELTV